MLLKDLFGCAILQRASLSHGSYQGNPTLLPHPRVRHKLLVAMGVVRRRIRSSAQATMARMEAATSYRWSGNFQVQPACRVSIRKHALAGGASISNSFTRSSIM